MLSLPFERQGRGYSILNGKYRSIVTGIEITPAGDLPNDAEIFRVAKVPIKIWKC